MQVVVEGLRKVYPDGTEALRGVDLELGSGAVGVIGPNGSGKTTLLRILALLIEPSAGRLTIDGHDIADPRGHARIRATLGYLPQELGLPPKVTGRELLDYYFQLMPTWPGRRRARMRVAEVLERVALSAVADRPIGGYSGGMRRRLGIATAIVHAPRLLIVDEPTSALDPEERVRFRNLIADLGTDGAVLLSTHLIADVEATCDDLFVMRHGSVLFHGTPTELMSRVDPATGVPTLEAAYLATMEGAV